MYDCCPFFLCAFMCSLIRKILHNLYFISVCAFQKGDKNLCRNTNTGIKWNRKQNSDDFLKWKQACLKILIFVNLICTTSVTTSFSKRIISLGHFGGKIREAVKCKGNAQAVTERHVLKRISVLIGGVMSSEVLPFKVFSVQFSHSVLSNSFWPHGLQYAKPPCSSPAPKCP